MFNTYSQFNNQFSLFRIRQKAELHPIIASLDCHDDATIQVAKNFGNNVKTIIEVCVFFCHLRKKNKRQRII
jgi:hypothetical protein